VKKKTFSQKNNYKC